jgi:hypothetical protein
VKKAANWVTRNGRNIAVSDMAERHLRNTIRFLRRHSDYLVIRYLKDTAGARSNPSEHATDAFDHEAMIAADGTNHDRCMFAYDKYRALYAEAQQRWGADVEAYLSETVEQDKNHE